MFKILRYLIVVSISLLFFLFSQENTGVIETGYTETLIDFSILGDKNQLGGDDENLSKIAEGIHNENWLVELNSSANFVANRRMSYSKNIQINKSKIPSYVGDNLKDSVLGIRANFPFSKYDASVEIYPKTEFSFYAGQNGKFYTRGKGVVQNVTLIKSIHVYVKGRNFPLDLYVNLENSDGDDKSYRIGNIDFENWRELIWNNPDYIANIKQRDLRDKKTNPVYPYLQNSLRLKSLKLVRRGDFTPIVTDSVFYVAWIKIVYDKASLNEGGDDEEINDEENWGVYRDTLHTKFSTDVNNLKYLEVEEIEKRLMNYQLSDGSNDDDRGSSADVVGDYNAQDTGDDLE